jgi:NAD(P)H-nitrite reductase large subunit
MMSACGVLCSECPAYHGAQKGIEHQRRTVEAWQRIYGLKETAAHISCGGCLGPDEEIFHTSLNCKARGCCRSKGFNSCAECQRDSCPELEKAQSVWDEVPDLIDKLSAADFAAYARPYCDHRKRLTDARLAFHKRS